MLILTRRLGEAIKIGDEVNVCVLGVKGNQVKLGINAPEHVPVHREEIYHRIALEKAREAYKSEGKSKAAAKEAAS